MLWRIGPLGIYYTGNSLGVRCCELTVLGILGELRLKEFKPGNYFVSQLFISRLLVANELLIRDSSADYQLLTSCLVDACLLMNYLTTIYHLYVSLAYRQ